VLTVFHFKKVFPAVHRSFFKLKLWRRVHENEAELRISQQSVVIYTLVSITGRRFSEGLTA
jgi:hypothetical protein